MLQNILKQEDIMEKTKMMKKLPFVLGTTILITGLVFVPSILAGDDSKHKEAENETPVFSVKAAEAELRTLRSYLELNGDIVSGRQVTVFPETGGKLARLLVDLGSVVHQGQLMAQVDPSRPGLQYMMNSVYAPISGTVSAVPLAVGSTVSQGDCIAVISVIENLHIEALIPERELSQLGTGLKADVTLQAYPGEIFAATVAHVSPVLDPASRTKKIVLIFDGNDSRISAGMFACIAINTRTYENVITIPTEAVIDHFGKEAVYVLRKDVEGLAYAELREVSTGAVIDNLAEVKTGIAVGERVLVQGQQFISDGVAVRVIAGGNVL
jgi:multidrug efflux pump subunit AcrA (membrane-fusion protein)